MKLVVGNSLSQLQGLTPKEFAEVREILSYKIDAAAAYHTGGRNPTRYLIDKKGFFPTGLINYVYDWVYTAQPKWDTFECQDMRLWPDARTPGEPSLMIPGNFPTPYPEQVEAVEAVKKAGRGICVAPTGSGKSLMIALTIDAFQVKTLVVVPSLELKAQLTASLKHWFGGYLVGDFAAQKMITVENVDALPLIPHVGTYLVIVDELHHVAAKTYRDLNLKSWKDVVLRVGFTATPFRSNDAEKMLFESFLSEVIHRIEYKDCVANKRIVPLEVFYIDLPKTKMKGNPKSWPAVYSELIVNNVERNRIIAKLLNSTTAPTLCLVKEIKHGEILSKLTGGITFANGQDGFARLAILEFCMGQIDRLIGTTGVLGEGIDTKPAELVILAGGGKSKNQLMQSLGRTFRNYTGKTHATAILFRDSSNPFLLKHFNLCVKHIKEEYCVTPTKLDFV